MAKGEKRIHSTMIAEILRVSEGCFAPKTAARQLERRDSEKDIGASGWMASRASDGSILGIPLICNPVGTRADEVVDRIERVD